MTSAGERRSVSEEQQRIVAEYRRREREVDQDLYALWNPSASLNRAGRTRRAARLLRQCGVFPTRGDACLEIGFGQLGWLAELLSWGLAESDLHGIELDAKRAAMAREAFPTADLRVGDASQLPWPADSFRLVITSTTFSSILDPAVRRLVAAEIVRVLVPGGALLWYDLRMDNPRNPNVRGIGRREIAALFPALAGPVRSSTLAPPLARRVAPVSWLAASVLEALPFLRTHLIAVLIKGASKGGS
jgi:ubiquinone/menaquinone biosynthesis C-methylase UbiE